MGRSTFQVDDAVAAELDPDELYDRLRAPGQQHGPAFQGIAGLTVSSSGAARAEVRLPAKAKAGSRKFLLHPVAMDIAVQTLGATRLATELSGGQDQRATVLPVRFAGIHVYGDVADGVRAIGTLTTTDSPDRLVGQVLLTRRRRPATARNRRSRHGSAAITRRRNRTQQSPVHAGVGADGTGQAGRRSCRCVASR